MDSASTLMAARCFFSIRRVMRVITTAFSTSHSQSFFTGDTFGISYREFDVDGMEFVFPTTTPVQFDPAAAHASLDRLMSYHPSYAFLTHYRPHRPLATPCGRNARSDRCTCSGSPQTARLRAWKTGGPDGGTRRVAAAPHPYPRLQTAGRRNSQPAGTWM